MRGGINVVCIGRRTLRNVRGQLYVRGWRKDRLRQNDQHRVQRRAHALLRDHGVRNGKRRDAQRHQRPGRRHLLLHPRRGGERARRGHDQGRKHEGGRRYAGASGHHIDRGSNGIDGVQDVGRGLRQRRHRSECRDVRFIHDNCGSVRHGLHILRFGCHPVLAVHSRFNMWGGRRDKHLHQKGEHRV